jgi:hypothetical protein
MKPTLTNTIVRFLQSKGQNDPTTSSMQATPKIQVSSTHKARLWQKITIGSGNLSPNNLVYFGLSLILIAAWIEWILANRHFISSNAMWSCVLATSFHTCSYIDILYKPSTGCAWKSPSIVNVFIRFHKVQEKITQRTQKNSFCLIYTSVQQPIDIGKIWGARSIPIIP